MRQRIRLYQKVLNHYQFVKMSNKFPVRYVIVRGEYYLRKEDVINFIIELGASEEVDVRNRLNKAAENLKRENNK